MNNIEEWFENLPLDKHMFIAQHVKKKLDKIQKDTKDILDSCYIGAMIELFDINLNDCIKIAEKANENMDITLKILSKEGEKYYMKVNNEELRKEIKTEIKALIKENKKINNLEIIRVLRETYDFPNKDFQILIKESRQELEKVALNELEKDIRNDSELSDREIEIKLSQIPKYATGEVKATLANEADHEFEYLSPNVGIDLVGEGKESITVTITPATLKVTETIKKIEGQYGNYIKSSEGVEALGTGQAIFKDITIVQEEAKTVQSKYSASREEQKAKIEELQERIKTLTSFLESLDLAEKKELEKYAEIEAVFSL